MLICWFPTLASASGLTYAFKHSDVMGQFFVILLLISSVFTWTIMIERGLFISRAKRLSMQFMQGLKRKRHLPDMYRECRNNPCPLAIVYKTGMDKLLDFYSVSPEQLLSSPEHYQYKKLSDIQKEAVRISMEREVSYQIEDLERRVGMLATVVSASPFLGLLGTVWGIMVAFCGIAAQGRAEIGALAPGISGALLTTVVALVVAIPSLIGYNLITANIRNVIVHMDNFVEEFMGRVNLEQLEVDKNER
jgi:biopolymer transport protein ExbB/TolQ